MQNVSPGMENEGTGRDVTGYNHVTVPGIVNVEQKISSLKDLSGTGCNGSVGTGQTRYPQANRGATS
jgi:hypothetical protein